MLRETLSNQYPLQPRHPMLVRKLEQSQTRLRVAVKRAARRLLLANGIDPSLLAAARGM